MMKKRYVIFALTSSLILLLAAVAWVFNMRLDYTPPPRDDGYTPMIGGHSSRTETHLENVTNWSDVVVLAEVTALSSELAPCCNSMSTRAAEHFPTSGGPTRLQETIKISVQDTYKGNAPAVLTIETQKPGGTVGRSGDEEHLAPMVFVVGQQYVLFLVERADHYEVQAYAKGFWAVNGDAAVQAWTDESYTKTQLRDKVASYQ